MASLNGDGENCEAANGVKFVEIHFSSVDAARLTKTVGVLPRRTPSPFSDRGRGALLNINYHPGGITLSLHFGSQRISTHRARCRGMCKWRKISCTIRMITCDTLAETLSAFSSNKPTISHFLKSAKQKDDVSSSRESVSFLRPLDLTISFNVRLFG